MSFLWCTLSCCGRHLRREAARGNTAGVFSSNYSCDQYTCIDNIPPKVFFFLPPQNPSKVKGPFSCNHLGGGGVGGGGTPSERWPSINNNRWTSWQFIVLWSDVPQQWGERWYQHLKKPCKGPTWTKTQCFKIQTISRSLTRQKTASQFQVQPLENKYAAIHPRGARQIPLHGHPDLLMEATVMNIGVVIIPGDYMLIHSRLFVRGKLHCGY